MSDPFLVWLDLIEGVLEEDWLGWDTALFGVFPADEGELGTDTFGVGWFVGGSTWSSSSPDESSESIIML